MGIGDKVWILTAVATPIGPFHETRNLDGVILDLQTITKENIVVMDDLLRAGHAELYKPEKADETPDILPDSAAPGTRSRKRNLRAAGG